MRDRLAGRVRVRWFGDSSSAVEASRQRVDTVLRRATKKWFRSNNSPDAFVMMIVIERGDHTMSDEEADHYIKGELNLKRASREIFR